MSTNKFTTNNNSTLVAVSSSDGELPVYLYADPATHSLLVSDTIAASATGGATPYHLVSAASTNATSVKASAGTVYHISAGNVNAAARYLKLYDKASAPTVGTDVPVHTFIVPGNTTGAGTNLPIGIPGIAFTTGIALALTTEATDAGSTGVALSELTVNLAYK